MSAADEWRAIADEIRAIPAEFGLREYTVSVIVSEYTGDELGDGSKTATSMPILVAGTANPKVRFPSNNEIALGAVSLGTVIVGPFTPFYGSGGIPRGTLDGSDVERDKQLLQFWIQGPNYPTGCAFRLNKYQPDRALRVTLELVPVEQTV